MKLVLKDNSEIELSVGNTQNQFVVSYQNTSELDTIESLLTANNLSEAQYVVGSTITDTLHNKVLSGSTRDLINHKATFYLADAKTAEMEQLQATVTQLQTEKNELQTICVENSLALCEVYELLLGSNENSSDDSSDDTESEENTESEGDTE